MKYSYFHTQKTIPKKKIAKLYNEIQQNMLNILNQCHEVEILAVFWNSNSTGILFITVTVHFIWITYEY